MKIIASYTLKMTYDNMYRIMGKSQHLSQTGVQFDGTLSAGYDLKYTYCGEEGKRFQLAGVDDVNYSAETVTEESKVVNAHAYEYDANGNLVFVNTSRTKKDGQTTPNAGERKLKWDEENRLTASDDNGFVTSYWYDASGERTVKSSGENAAMFVNAEFAGGMTNTAKFSLYVSPYLVANQGGRYTKHIYIGSQRIVSKLGDLKSYGADPRRIEYAGSESDGPKIDYKTKYALQQQVIKDNFAYFDVPYNGADNNDYVDGKGFSERDGSLKSAMLKAAMAKEGNKSAGLKDNFQQGDSYEQYQYFYHPDHLGSSSFITNTEGEVVQHIEYVPYGEVFIEDRNNVWNTPYLFNAKEFDEETGLYYYGARYYDSRLAIWYGVDALAEKYPNMGGYVYCAGNPVKFVDPDGNKIIIGTALDQFLNFFGYKTDFVKAVEKDISTLKSLDKDVKKTIEDLENSPYEHHILHTDKGNQTIYDKRKADKQERQGTTIKYNEKDDVPHNSKNPQRDKRSPLVGLGHEIKHSSDVDKGIIDNTVYPPSEIPQREIDAVNFENKIRKKLDLPKRTQYADKPIPSVFLE